MALRSYTPDVQADDYVKQMTSPEARAMLDRMSRFTLHVSGDDFLERWDAGEYRNRLDDPRVKTVARLMRIVRSR